MQTEKVELPAGTMSAILQHFASQPSVQIWQALQQAKPVDEPKAE